MRQAPRACSPPLGDARAFSDPPRGGGGRFARRPGGKVARDAGLNSLASELFRNAAAQSLGPAPGAAHPRLEAELPAGAFRGSRPRGFVPPVTPGAAFTIRKPPAV